MLGKAASSQRHALLGYGRDLGAAFQIADDLLDATATPEEAGKRTGKDAEAGKATLVSLLGPERARIQAALPRLPAVIGSVLLFVQPMTTLLLGTILLGELPSAAQLGGVLLVIGGMALATGSVRRAWGLLHPGPATG